METVREVIRVKMQDEVREDNEDGDEMVWHYPWNITALFLGEWKRITPTNNGYHVDDNDDDDPAAAVPQQLPPMYAPNSAFYLEQRQKQQEQSTTNGGRSTTTTPIIVADRLQWSDANGHTKGTTVCSRR